MNRAKRKGTRHEVQTRDYLNSRSAEAFRLALGGADDAGDIHAVWLPEWLIECKDTAGDGLAAAVDEALREAAYANKRFACVVKKRRRAPVHRNFVVMELGQWCDLMGLPSEQDW